MFDVWCYILLLLYYIILLLYIILYIHILLYIILYLILYSPLHPFPIYLPFFSPFQSSSSILPSSPNLPLPSIFLPFLSFPLIYSFYTCRSLLTVIYIPDSFQSSHLIHLPFLSSPLLFYLPNIPFLSSSPHSKYTCRCLLLDTYISSSSRHSDPACFIGWECRVVQF